MTDVDKFVKFRDAVETAIRSLDGAVTDLEVGVDAQVGSWLLEGARRFANVEERAPESRLGNGDVQIRFVRGVPNIRLRIGRVLVDVVPRFSVERRR